MTVAAPVKHQRKRLDPRAVALALIRATRKLELDPLSQFSFVNGDRYHLAQIQFVWRAVTGIETYLRSGNQGGKTWVGCALAIALAQGRTELGGIPLPKLRLPNVGWILSKTHQQQVDSVQLAFLELLGSWPHKISYVNSGLEYIGVIRVKPIGCTSDDPKHWSRVVFHVEGRGKSLPGGRIDWAMADEPPDMRRWREVRARGRKNEPFLRWITATPLYREEWEELREDFKGCQGFVSKGRIEIRSTVYDNPWLSEEHIRALEESYEGDPLKQARLNSDYIDTSGSCPFHRYSDTLSKLEREATPPKILPIEIYARLDTAGGRLLEKREVQYEEWWPPEDDEEYYLVLDTATGVRDRIHDPGCAHVYARKRPRLVARFNDYEASYALGWISSVLGAKYKNAWVDVEMNGGYGDAALDALADAGYGWLMMTVKRDRFGKVERKLGFTTTDIAKGGYISQIQKVLEHGTVEIPSAAVVSTLMGITVDSRGIVQEIEGRHDEDFICLGRFAYMSTMLGVTAIPPTQEEAWAATVNRSFGREVITPREKEQIPVDRWR